MSKSKYHAVFSVDTRVDNRLDGYYTVEGYVLKPCLLTPENRQRNLSRFVLEFDFYGLNEKNVVESSERNRRRWENRNKGAQKAKIFIAWLVLATREWARLSSQHHGPMMSFGPYVHYPVEDFDESILETTFHVDKKVKNGEFFEVKRPSYSFSSKEPLTNLKLPSDFPSLTKKIFSLRKKEREKFLNACFSYQFALDNWTAYPTISILSLVSAVESMMADEYTSGFCKDANKQCPLKKNVMKKFRAFFERNLQYPLPKQLETFLNSVYSKRSKYVHNALLGGAELHGIRSLSSKKMWELTMEQRYLAQLVNAALLEWLKRI